MKRNEEFLKRVKDAATNDIQREAIKSATDSACDKSNFPFLKARIVNSPAVAILQPLLINNCNSFC